MACFKFGIASHQFVFPHGMDYPLRGVGRRRVFFAQLSMACFSCVAGREYFFGMASHTMARRWVFCYEVASREIHDESNPAQHTSWAIRIHTKPCFYLCATVGPALLGPRLIPWEPLTNAISRRIRDMCVASESIPAC